ncbi:hypothetical protein J0871_17150 [Salegentibacter sp. BDJ18]|uniref:hypothetical protein n=1 Tax=Salegentibacter sp. BDJ18 TaxID=2816376 RepID=UPI001AAEE3A1|nr:hypothetical protein [Salegentibacter sp. BDJ18]MBO2546146.1 hypothetical protein [Salegentibacter sp. BDJ18]
MKIRNSKMVLISKLVLVVTAITFSSCTSPKLIKRYENSRNIWLSDSDVKNYVDVITNTYKIEDELKENNVFVEKNVVIENDNSKPKSLFDLSEKAQEKVIQAYLVNNPDFEISDLMGDVNISGKLKKPSKKKSSGIVKYKTKYVDNELNKNLLFSVIRVYSSEPRTIRGKKFLTLNNVGDRIQFLDLRVSFDNSNLKIINWNKFENAYTQVDFGTLTSEKGIEASISVGYEQSANIGTTNKTTSIQSGQFTESDNIVLSTEESENGGSNTMTSTNNSNLNNLISSTGENINTIGAITKLAPSAKIVASDRLGENRSFQNEILKLTGTLNDRSFEIRQEGFEGIDLKGNTSINLDLKFTGPYKEPLLITLFDNLFFKTDSGLTVNPFDSINKTYTYLFIPDIEEDVTAYVEYKYLYRNIRGGDKYIPEYKHEVKFLFGEATLKNKLASEIVLLRKSDLAPKIFHIFKGGESLKLDDSQLNFEKKEDAMNFITWLTASNDISFYTKRLGISDLESFSIESN